MNIGSLYRVKQWYWLLFSSKESAVFVRALSHRAHRHIADIAAAYYSAKQPGENVTYFSPDSHIVFLGEDGKIKNVLTSEGLIGWTWFDEAYNSCFEEVST
jgi:hypothetical protein